jgi:hypothetical protein
VTELLTTSVRADPVRRFAVAWRNPVEPAISPIGLLEFAGDRFVFRYLASVRDLPGFRPLLSFPDFERAYTSPVLFPFFAQRVMDRKRPEFADYVASLGLGPFADDLDILGRVGGQRKADNVQVVEAPAIHSNWATEHDFLVHGLRHSALTPERREEVLGGLKAGARLELVPQPDNPVNRSALVVATTDNVGLGWVPDLLLEYVHAVRSRGRAALSVVRVNGPDSPSHLRLVVQLRGQVPEGYRPFTGPTWTPVVNEVPA